MNENEKPFFIPDPQIPNFASRFEVTVGELGFSDGADVIEINRVLNSLGFENFPDDMLLAAAKRPRIVYSGDEIFNLLLRRHK